LSLGISKATRTTCYCYTVRKIEKAFDLQWKGLGKEEVFEGNRQRSSRLGKKDEEDLGLDEGRLLEVVRQVRTGNGAVAGARVLLVYSA